jgi:hypothetical protein
MKKMLITGGCSFSDVKGSPYQTWPKHLSDALPDYESIHTGSGSHGNGIISRKIIYELQNCLNQNVCSENILVGIMWSGPTRYDIFSDNYPEGYDKNSEIDMTENPTGFVRENPSKQWYIFNWNWKKTKFNATWYQFYHSLVMHQLLTIEHILRIQWFCKSHGIKYFMTCYTSKVFMNDVIDHPEVKYLYDMIDFENFLPIVGAYEWCRDHSKFNFPISGDNHPGTEQHRDFVDQIVCPWLTSKKFIR